MRWLYPEGWLIPPTNPTHPRARARRPTHIRPQRPRSIALTTPDPDPPAPTLPPPDTGRKPRRETPVRGRTRPPPRPVSLWQSPHHTRSTLPTPRPKGHQYAPFVPCSRTLKRSPRDPHTILHHTTTTPPHTHTPNFTTLGSQATNHAHARSASFTLGSTGDTSPAHAPTGYNQIMPYTPLDNAPTPAPDRAPGQTQHDDTRPSTTTCTTPGHAACLRSET